MRYEIGRVLKQEQVMKLVFGRCAVPKSMLGRHLIAGGQVIAAYHPNAVRVRLLIDGDGECEMDMVERQPVFAVFLPHQQIFSYRLKMYLRDGETIILHDPYRFPCQITEEEEKAFLQGRWLDAYQKMGCHPMEIDGVKGMYFAVWAPQVQSVSVVGDFNGWDGRLCPMNRMGISDIYEVFLPGLEEGTGYQYEVRGAKGEMQRVADPYGTARDPGKISKMLNVRKFPWNDDDWMQNRKRQNVKACPVVICNLSGQNPEMLDNINKKVFTHVMLSKEREPDVLRYTAYSDGGDFFVPPAGGRDPDDFRRFVQKAHREGLGVILAVSLEMIPCEKPQIADFLLSNLLFWIREYHIDGFAFDGLAGDCRTWIDRFNDVEVTESPEEGEMSLDDESRRAILRRAMEMIRREAPGVVIISDELNLRKPGDSLSDMKDEIFDFYWNYRVKWSLDSYLSHGRAGRRREHFRLTLPLQKPGLGRSLFLLDHKILIHRKQTSIDKSKEVYYDMLSEAKLSYTFLTGIPGRKILAAPVEHTGIRKYLFGLLEMYCSYPALYGSGEDEQVFEWVNGMDAVSSVISFIRKSSACEEHFLFICNFSADAQISYRVGVPVHGTYRLLMNSDAVEYGGKGRFVHQHPAVTRQPCDFLPYSMTVSLPPESALIFGYGPAFHSISQRQ